MNGDRSVIDHRSIGTLLRDRRAVGAVEFAMTAPFLILLYLGGYQLMDAISAYRKVTLTTRALADLITRTPATEALTSSKVQTILDASRQIMVPFSVGNATVRITTININSNRRAAVDWSEASDGNVNRGSDLAVPNKLKVANTSVVLSEVTYHYTPVVGGSLVGPLVFKDQIYMNPPELLLNSLPGLLIELLVDSAAGIVSRLIGMNMARIMAALARFRGHCRGNILIIFAFAMIPMVFATAMGVDYTRAARLQTKMNALADAAALAAVTQPMMKQTAGSACDVARNTFTTQSAPLAEQGLVFRAGQAKQFTITVSDTVPKSDAPVVSTCLVKTGATGDSGNLPLARTATVTYVAASTNSFGGILGMDTLPIAGTATANTTLAPYIDIYMALDTSQSMGLAATTTDAAALYAKTGAENGEACTFGCHVSKTFQKTTNDAIAAKYNIQLRIDVLKAATVDMIKTAKADQGEKDLYRFGLYQFGQSLSNIYKIDHIKDNDDALNYAEKLTLGPNTSAGNGDSNIDDMISRMYSRITVHGDGIKPEDARAFLFIVTDGLYDMCNNNHCTHVIDPKQCQRYKDAGITVGIVYTTYLPIMANPEDSNNKNLQSDYIRLVVTPGLDKTLAPSLEQCASPGWFFEASDGPGIHSAMQKLFTQASQVPALTS